MGFKSHQNTGNNLSIQQWGGGGETGLDGWTMLSHTVEY